MKIPAAIVILGWLSFMPGCAMPDPAEQARAEKATLQAGNPKEMFLVTFGQSLPHPPAQVREYAQRTVPAGSSWATWRIRHRDEKFTAGFDRSSMVNVTTENGEAMPMVLGNHDNGGFKVLFLFAVFDPQGRFTRHVWMENVDESE